MGKSLEFVKAGINAGDIKVTDVDVNNLKESGNYVAKIFQDIYGKIWNDDNGMSAKAKDPDTGKEKLLKVKYDKNAEFGTYVVATGYDIEEKDRPTLGYMKLMGQIISDIVWFKVCDTKQIGSDYFDNEDKFWNYDETYFIGDFVLYQDTKEEYKDKPLMIEEINDIIRKNADAKNGIIDAEVKEETIDKEIPSEKEDVKEYATDGKIPTRFIAILPITIVYKEHEGE